MNATRTLYVQARYELRRAGGTGSYSVPTFMIGNKFAGHHPLSAEVLFVRGSLLRVPFTDTPHDVNWLP